MVKTKQTPSSTSTVRGSDENLKSLVKIMRVLECFSVNDRALSLSEICDRTGFPRSTTHRLMASLKEVGFLDQDRERDKYRLGLKLFEFGNIVLMNLDLHREARPIVEALKRMSGQMVHLAIFDGQSAVVIHRADPSPDHAPTSTSIENAPVHCTSVGKAILAWQPEPVIQKIVQAGLRSYTDATITTGPTLFSELDRVRQRGYAIDDGEHQPGLRCVGAPIRDQFGHVIAGISVSGPSWQINMSDIEELSKVVIHHANMISHRIGHHP
ncbi:IclR family transcriptional regulator [Rhizobium sp. 16-488-2a]|nr:IclR family transcriptional regulator [Rhizobium sp. 16-488-2b]MBO9178279.1 IclR family transcriptional regulator [Rhizobium sp. 16-488-2a]